MGLNFDDPTIKLQISARSKDLKLHNPSLVKKYNTAKDKFIQVKKTLMN